MKLPFIVITDDDDQVLRAIKRDVRNKFREDYKILAMESAFETLETVKELKSKNETVALFISDQHSPFNVVTVLRLENMPASQVVESALKA